MAARAKGHKAHAPLLLQSSGARLDGPDDDAAADDAAASMPMIELALGHVNTRKLALLAAAVAAHAPSARDQLLDALDSHSIHVLR